MPLVWNDRIVGRADVRNDAAERTLHINGVWIEQPVENSSHEALNEEFSRLATFVGSAKFEVHSTHQV